MPKPVPIKFVVGIFILAVFGICVWLELPNRVQAARDDDEVTVKKEKGLSFKVADDWPIEERNGLVGPIPIEEYVSIKFKDIRTQLSNLSQQMSVLDLRLQTVEKQLKTKNQLNSSTS